jgi:dihydroorotate dehydrogenase
LKLSPDLDHESLESVLKISNNCGVSGWILTNTTIERTVQTKNYPIEGGVSGAPLSSKSLEMLKWTQQYLDQQKIKDKLIISTGGVFSAEHVLERLNLGAHLIQFYSALVFEGPWIFRNLVHQLQQKERP